MVVSANLKQLPPEVIGMICALLPAHNIAALELSCIILKEKVDRSNVWQKKALALDLPEGSFVLAMLKFVRGNHIMEPSAYKVILGTHQLIESTISDFNRILFTWRCLQPEYQAINGGVTCKNPGSHETITDIITKGLFIDMRHYIQGLELFEEVKLSQIVSWNSSLHPHNFYDVDMDPEYLMQREKFFQRIFLPRSGSLDVSDSIHKIELLNSRKEPFFSETAEAMADIIANTLKVNQYPLLVLPPNFISFLASWPWQRTSPNRSARRTRGISEENGLHSGSESD